MFTKSNYYLGITKENKDTKSLKVKKVLIEEFSQTFTNVLKDIAKSNDFNQLVDWQNSSLYKTTLRTQIKA